MLYVNHMGRHDLRRQSQKTCQFAIRYTLEERECIIMLKRRKYYILALLFAPILAWGQDTLLRATLPEIKIINIPSSTSLRFAQTPTQVTTQEQIVKLGDAVLSDALKRMSGVTLKDYGGVGGIKTVSVRGLGSQFSTLTIDGIAVTDCQNGQVDLGRYTLGNSSHISLHNGQADSRLNSARALASGSIVNMETASPLDGQIPHTLQLDLEGGSFGYFSPTLSLNQKLGSHCAISLMANHTRSEGNYPFTLYYTASHQDSSSLERRQNSQMSTSRADVNFFYRPTSNQQLHTKVHYMQGYHALPGPVVYYSTRGSEHSQEQLFFAQTRYRANSQHWDLQLLGKYQQGTDIYEDTAALNAQHLIHNEYHQSEGYLSQAVRYHTGGKNQDSFSINLALDESANHLTSNLSTHNQVQRLALLGALGIEYKPAFASWIEGAKLNANILCTLIQDNEQGLHGTPYRKCSPYAGINWQLGHFVLRCYMKENYRVPNFNELYYFTVGRTLKPEKASQLNLGTTYSSPAITPAQGHTMRLSATADAYYNRVSDKIIAYPTNNMYLWTMKNLGEVEIAGTDITGSASLDGLMGDSQRPYSLSLSMGYTYQYAVDKTSPTSKFYGHQIPYTPRHSGSISLIAETHWLDLGLTTLIVGPRYSLQQNTEQNRVKGYVDQGITLSRKLFFNRSTLTLKVQVLNLLDIQYEVVKNYPMMGRNYRLGVTWTL